MKRTSSAPGGYGGGGGAGRGGGGGGYGGRGGGGAQQPAKKPRVQNDDFDESGFMPEEEFDMSEGQYERIEDVEGEDASSESQSGRWIRQHNVPHDSTTQPLIVHWLDIDMISGPPLIRNPAGGDVIGSTDVVVPIVRLYGVTQEGHSAMIHVHGVTPYFYASFAGFSDLSDHNLGLIRSAMDLKMREKARGDEKQLKSLVLGLERTPPMQSLVGYHSNDVKEFVKIYVAMPSLVPGTKRLVDEGVTVPSLGTLHGQTFESNVPFVLRFMIDLQISGADWVELPANAYALRPAETLGLAPVSRCTFEADVCYPSIVSHPCTGSWSSIAPLRILSFDIECQGRKGHFPDASMDPVIQIASVLSVQGQDSTPLIRTVFTLNSCLPIVGAVVDASETEAEMLMKWRNFLVAADPDIITGYNIGNFDIPYLLNRAKVLEKQYPRLKAFADLGRIKGVKAIMRDTTFQSSAFGKRENVETTILGRVMFDVLPYMQRNHKLSSYTLNSVSAEFLGQQKEDVHHSIISDLQNGTDADRRRLAVYCLKDAYLPLLLLKKLSVIVNYVEMARVTGVPLNFILTRGQQIKVFSMILRKCLRENLLVPHLAKSGANDDISFEGATVIEPKKAFYEVPIATLDFASLYPSIMQAYNLCYSTLVTEREAQKLDPASYEKSPAGHIFIRSQTKRGILPQILDELLAARKRAKKDMNAATDPMEKAVQNGRQLALKISANSVYGFTGATVGQLPCLPIASTVTAYGRNLLLATKSFVEATYTQAKGYPFDAEVVYGDTDSVMVKFGHASVAEAMPLARQAAAEVSAIFPSPIQLEFEKVYFPYLLMNKKRYAGLLWTQPEVHDKMDAKGLETVRRDNCLMVRQVVETCLRKILIDRDVSSALSYTKSIISDLLQNKLDISMLVITKSLGRSADDSEYSAKQAHVELAMRMRKRDPGSAPSVGDRVPYVIIQAAKGAPAYEKSEDPVYVLEHNLPIDTEYYLHNQLSGPLQRIFEPIISNPQSLITGDHTRVVCRPTPKAGGIMNFAVKKETCMSCKTVLTATNTNAHPLGGVAPLCRNCQPKEAEIYISKLDEVNVHQRVYNALWTECQRCQGSYHQEVLCSNRDCPIFYKRKKVQIDLQAAQEALDRFAW